MAVNADDTVRDRLTEAATDDDPTADSLVGVPVGVRHPSRRGGRVTDTPAVAARLTIQDETLQIHDASEIPDVTVRFADIVYSREDQQEINDTVVDTLSIRHLNPPSTVLTTAISAWDDAHHDQLIQIVTDYYQTQRETIATLELSVAQLELLVRLYSLGEEIDPSAMMEHSSAELAELFEPLREAEVLRKGETGVFLTGRGYMLVNEEIDAETM